MEIKILAPKPDRKGKGTPRMALVLCTGVDPVLMATSKLILERAGHTVIPASNEHELEAACSKQALNVAVIGQNISAKVKGRVLDLVRKYCPSTRILELYPPYGSKALETADAWLEMPTEAPEALADAVDSLASAKRVDCCAIPKLVNRKK